MARRKAPAMNHPGRNMLKLTLATAAALLAFVGAATAETKSWNVTEESADGVGGAQGTWTVTIAGDKLSGKAQMQFSNGELLSYSLDGSIKDGVYTVNLVERSDGKKGCVWTGHAPSGAGAQTKGLVGYAPCEGAKLIVRAFYF
jgi:hypothetical protein